MSKTITAYGYLLVAAISVTLGIIGFGVVMGIINLLS